LSAFQNLEKSAKMCTELRWDYVKQIPSVFAVLFFLLVRVTELSAPTRILTVLGKYIEVYVILNCVLLSVFQCDLY